MAKAPEQAQALPRTTQVRAATGEWAFIAVVVGAYWVAARGTGVDTDGTHVFSVQISPSPVLAALLIALGVLGLALRRSHNAEPWKVYATSGLMVLLAAGAILATGLWVMHFVMPTGFATVVQFPWWTVGSIVAVG